MGINSMICLYRWG